MILVSFFSEDNVLSDDIKISLFNKPSDLWFILTQQSLGEYGKSSHLSIFTSLKHFNDAFKTVV